MVFKQCNPKKKKTQTSRHQNVQTMDCSGYTYNMNVYLGKERQRAEQHMTATCSTMTNLTKGVKGFGHKLHMDNFVSSSDLWWLGSAKKNSCCGTVRLHGKGMPKDLKSKTLRMKQGDNSCGVEWQDRRVPTDKNLRSTQGRQLSCWTRERDKAGNCGGL